MNTQRQYPTNVTQAQWQLLLPLLPKRKMAKRQPWTSPANLRQVFNGILYLTKTGCQWRMLPHTFGCWQTVYGYFNKWREQGVFERVQQVLTRRERKRQGRSLTHRQAAVTAKVSRRQHKENQRVTMLVKRSMDANAICLSIPSDSSSAPMSRLLISQDRDGLKQVINQYFDTGETRLRKLWVDGGYRGEDLKEWVAAKKHTYKIDLEVVTPKGKGFQLVNVGGSSSALCLVI